MGSRGKGMKGGGVKREGISSLSNGDRGCDRYARPIPFVRAFLPRLGCVGKENKRVEGWECDGTCIEGW